MTPAGTPVTEETLDKALREVWPGLRAYVGSLLIPQRDAIDDVLQETALHVWENRVALPGIVEFNRWVFRIAYFKALSVRRDFARNAKWMIGDDALDVLEKTAARLLENGAEPRLDALERCLASLKKDDLALVVWRYSENRSLTELARMRNCEPNAMHLRISRLRRALRLCVERKLKQGV